MPHQPMRCQDGSCSSQASWRTKWPQVSHHTLLICLTSQSIPALHPKTLHPQTSRHAPSPLWASATQKSLRDCSGKHCRSGRFLPHMSSFSRNNLLMCMKGRKTPPDTPLINLCGDIEASPPYLLLDGPQLPHQHPFRVLGWSFPNPVPRILHPIFLLFLFPSLLWILVNFLN